MTDRELLEYIATQVGTLTGQVGVLTNQVGTLSTQFDTLMGQVDTLSHQSGTLTGQVGTLIKDVNDLKKGQKKIEIILEQDITPKIQVLFDGHKQHADQLARIEDEVKKHDEIILRKVR